MPIPRSYILNLAEPGWVHAISRCVRKAWLAGKGCDHRKDWVEDRLRMLSGVFGCEVAAYAVMSNHLHVVVRMRPDLVRTWDAERLAQGWFALFPGRGRSLPDGTALPPEPGMIRGFLADPERIAKARKRLGDLSWFMKCLKEGIARRANAEDDCTGAFWEGRYTSVPLLDQHALLSCNTTQHNNKPGTYFLQVPRSR